MLISTFLTFGYSSAVRVQFLDAAPPTPTSISCSVLSSSVSLAQPQVVSGSISPAVPNATVRIIYMKPDGSTINRPITTSADGSYSDTYTPDVTGSWSVKATWTGNDNFLGSTSFDTSFNVKGSSTSGFPMEYVYIAIVAVVVVVLAVAIVLWSKNRKKNT